MPNRFRGQQGFGRRDRSDDFGRGRSSGFRDRDFGNREFSDTSEQRFGRSYGAFDRGENYFGSGQQGFGDGIEDHSPNRSFGYSWRDSTGHSNYDYPERRYRSYDSGPSSNRETYGFRGGSDWEPETNRRDFRNEPFDRNRYVGNYRARRENWDDYPSSESGFYPTGGPGDRSWWDRASDEVSSWFGDEDAERRREMDVRRGLRGRGPRNYTRSDDRIREDINDRLTDYDYIDASDIEVRVENGEVVLSGFVESRYEKRLAEDITEEVSGVQNVENRIRIQREQTQYTGGDMGTGNTQFNQAGDTTTTDTSTTGKSRTATGRS